MSMVRDPVRDLILRINGHRKLRAWSVIITFFGDAVVPRGGAVSARTVQEVMGRLGFEPGTVRTAFSRLVQEGWVVREKQGRSSFFHLSDTGLDTFTDATRKIYAPFDSGTGDSTLWRLVFSQDNMNAPQITAMDSDVSDPDHLVICGRFETIPDWFLNQQFSPAFADAMRFLADAFAPVQNLDLEPLDALGVRCLLIHEWRRILLHLPAVPAPLRPPDWPEEDCHRFIASLYRQLLPASESWLDTTATGADGAMPPPSVDLKSRFS